MKVNYSKKLKNKLQLICVPVLVSRNNVHLDVVTFVHHAGQLASRSPQLLPIFEEFIHF